MAATESPPSANGVTSKEAWAALAVHTITLHSGAVVKIRIPDLSSLIRRDLLPEALRVTAMHTVLEALGGGDTPPETGDQAVKTAERLDTMKGLAELLDWLVSDMLVEPKLGPEELDVIPAEDKELLAAIAQRNRNVDAKGVWLGVEPLSRWETFRRLHGCEEDCAHCEAVQREFSTSDVGAV